MMIPFLLSFCAFSASFQTEAPPASPWTAEHAARELAHREAQFFHAWDQAPGERWRQFASVELEKGRRAGEPRTLKPSPAALNDSLHYLLRRDDPAGEVSPEQRFIDALSLTAVPGILPGAPNGERTPITVFIHPLYGLGGLIPTEPFELVLTWQGPEGVTEHARREFVHPLAVPGGFEMFVQSPGGAPGTWWVTPSLTTGQGETVVGRPLRFEIIPALDELRAALQAEVSGDELAEFRAERVRRALFDLDALRETGLQPHSMDDLMAGLGLTAMPEERTLFERLLASSGDEGDLHLEPQQFGDVEARGDVYLLLSSEESPGEVLKGLELTHWADLARSGWRVREFSGPLANDGRGGRCLQQILESRASKESAPLWLVARGDAASRLLLGTHGDTELGRAFRSHVDGLVLESAAPPRRTRSALMAPRWPEGPSEGLILTAGAEADGSQQVELPEGSHWTWWKRERPLFLARRELPGLLLNLLQQ